MVVSSIPTWLAGRLGCPSRLFSNVLGNPGRRPSLGDVTRHSKGSTQLWASQGTDGIVKVKRKDTLGVGQAQLWTETSVPKQPVLSVAAYSALLLASLKAFGGERLPYAELPKWRRSARRPSCLDLITLLRKEMTQQPTLLNPLGLQITNPQLVHAAAA